jgi:hypothetical protein
VCQYQADQGAASDLSLCHRNRYPLPGIDAFIAIAIAKSDTMLQLTPTGDSTTHTRPQQRQNRETSTFSTSSHVRRQNPDHEQCDERLDTRMWRVFRESLGAYAWEVIQGEEKSIEHVQARRLRDHVSRFASLIYSEAELKLVSQQQQHHQQQQRHQFDGSASVENEIEDDEVEEDYLWLWDQLRVLLLAYALLNQFVLDLQVETVKESNGILFWPIVCYGSLSFFLSFFLTFLLSYFLFIFISFLAFLFFFLCFSSFFSFSLFYFYLVFFSLFNFSFSRDWNKRIRVRIPRIRLT